MGPAGMASSGVSVVSKRICLSIPAEPLLFRRFFKTFLHAKTESAYGIEQTGVLTTYGHWVQGEEPFVVSIRLKLEEIDVLAKGME